MTLLTADMKQSAQFITLLRRVIAVAVFALVFYAVEHVFTSSVDLSFLTTEGVDLDDVVAAGNLHRKAAFAILGLLGVIAWRLPGNSKSIRSSTGAMALVLYFVWCVASLLWADDPAITVRRFGVLGFFFLAMIGVSKQCTARDLAWIVLGVGTLHLLWGISAEMRLGSFHPFDPEYRFAGTVHPNTQGIQCAGICLAAFALVSSMRRWRWGMWMLFAVSLVFLVLTKSRTSCAATALGLVAVWLPRAPNWVKAGTLIVVPFVAGSVLLVIFLFDFNIGDRLNDVVLMG